MVQVPGTPPANRQGTPTARITSDSTLTLNPTCPPKAVRRSSGDMLRVDREARAILDFKVSARK